MFRSAALCYWLPGALVPSVSLAEEHFVLTAEQRTTRRISYPNTLPHSAVILDRQLVLYVYLFLRGVRKVAYGIAGFLALFHVLLPSFRKWMIIFSLSTEGKESETSIF